ncbi:MAG: hypothetical protein ABI851_14760 [Saprospiraceae bacterium]
MKLILHPTSYILIRSMFRVELVRILTLFLTLFLLNSTTAQIDADFVKTDSRTSFASNNSLLSCTQADMDPCSYIDMNSFISALVTELNNQLTNCPARNWDCNPSPCCTTDVVMALSSLDPFTINPYFYCTEADCTTFTCDGTPAGSIHNYTDVALQNAILSDIRMKAYNARPYCGSSTTIKGIIYTYQVFAQVIGNCSSGGSPCYNAEIKVRVKYKCPCEGEGSY